MASFRCQSCGKVIRPIPKHCDKDMVIGEVNGHPALMCVNGHECYYETIPECCTMPGYTRWI